MKSLSTNSIQEEGQSELDDITRNMHQEDEDTMEEQNTEEEPGEEETTRSNSTIIAEEEDVDTTTIAVAEATEDIEDRKLYLLLVGLRIQMKK